MKRIWRIVLALLFFAAGCGAAHVPIVEKMPVPNDKPLYGYTEEGVFFLHQSLFENASGENPIVAFETSKFVGRNMKLKGEYYIYGVHQDTRDLRRFEGLKGTMVKIQYFFPIADHRILPETIKNRTDWIKQEDLFKKGGALGHIFNTAPVKNPFLDAGS